MTEVEEKRDRRIDRAVYWTLGVLVTVLLSVLAHIGLNANKKIDETFDRLDVLATQLTDLTTSVALLQQNMQSIEAVEIEQERQEDRIHNLELWKAASTGDPGTD